MFFFGLLASSGLLPTEAMSESSSSKQIDLAAAGIPSNLVESCIEKTCGPAATRLSRENIWPKIYNKLEAEKAWSIFRPEFNYISELEVKDHQRKSEFSLKVLKSKTKLKISEEILRKAFAEDIRLALREGSNNFFNLNNINEGRGGFIEVQELWRVSDKRQELLEEKNISEEVYTSIMSDFFLQRAEIEIAGTLLLSPLELVLRNERRRAILQQPRKGPLSIKEVDTIIDSNWAPRNELKAHARRAETNLNNLQKKLGESYFNLTFSPADISLVTEVAIAGDVRFEDQHKYLEAANKIQREYSIHLGLLKQHFDANDGALKAQAIFNQMFESRAEFTSFILSEDKSMKSGIFSKKGEDYKACLTLVKKITSVNLTQAHINEFSKLIKEIKETATLVSKNFTDDSSAHLELSAVVNNTTFTFPKTSQNDLADLRRAIAQKKSSLTLAASKKVDADTGYYFLLMKFFKYRLSLTDFMLLETQWMRSQLNEFSLIDFCSVGYESKFRTISDFATFGNAISTSWLSIKFPEYGVGIVAHEIGHAVSMHLHRRYSDRIPSADQMDPFSRSQECIANRNPLVENKIDFSALSAGELRRWNIGQWSEEDWADHFSIMVMDKLKKMNPKIKIKTFSCAMLEHDPKTCLSRINSARAIGDVHSPALLRHLLLLHDGTIKKEKVKECSRILERLNYDGRNLVCKPTGGLRSSEK